MFKKKLNNKKGFTLIELIVVIAILGILAAVAVPRISGFTTSAKTNTDKANKKLLYNVASIVIAADGDTSTSSGSITATNYATETDMGKYLDAWPVPQNGGSGFTVTVSGSAITVSP